MCARHRGKGLHQNVVVQKRLALQALVHCPSLCTNSLPHQGLQAQLGTPSFGSHPHSLPLNTAAPWPPLVWSATCSEGQTHVLTQNHLGSKFQGSDALTMIYKRDGHDSLTPQNLDSVGNGVSTAKLGLSNVLSQAGNPLFPSLTQYNLEGNAIGE